MTPPKVSVLMASYNMADFLPTAIDSVLEQDMGDLELVIGDNASTDSTPEIIQHYVDQDSRVKSFRNATNVRAVENFNLCYRRAHPESNYWAMLGSDDWWRPDLLSSLLSVAESDPELALVHADGYLVDENGEFIKLYSELWKHLDTPHEGPHRSVETIFQGNFIMAFAALVNRRISETLIPREDVFDPRFTFGPEYELWLQLFARGARAYYVHEPLVYYRKHGGAHTIPENTIRILRDETTMLRENLQDACANGLDTVRRTALQSRLAWIAFDLLQNNEPDEARALLDEATTIGEAQRLDINVASMLASLPLSASIRGYLWRQAFQAARLAGRTA